MRDEALLLRHFKMAGGVIKRELAGNGEILGQVLRGAAHIKVVRALHPTVMLRDGGGVDCSDGGNIWIRTRWKRRRRRRRW